MPLDSGPTILILRRSLQHRTLIKYFSRFTPGFYLVFLLSLMSSSWKKFFFTVHLSKKQS